MALDLRMSHWHIHTPTVSFFYSQVDMLGSLAGSLKIRGSTKMQSPKHRWLLPPSQNKKPHGAMKIHMSVLNTQACFFWLLPFVFLAFCLMLLVLTVSLEWQICSLLVFFPAAWQERKAESLSGPLSCYAYLSPQLLDWT